MKRILLTSLIGLSFSIFSSAQTFDDEKLETLLSALTTRTTTSEIIPTSSRIKDYYQSLNASNKKVMRNYMVDKIATLLDIEKKDEGLSVINVYYNLVDKNDDKLPTLLFLEGAIYAERMDTIHLQHTIDKLNNLPSNGEANQYVTKLAEAKKDIRNKIHIYKKLDGWWVADKLEWIETGKRQLASWRQEGLGSILTSLLGFPSLGLLVNINNDRQADSLTISINNKCMFANDLSSVMAKYLIQDRSYYSQAVVPYALDSIYILWSSESVNKNGIEIAPFVRGTVSATAAAVNAELAQHHKYSISESFWGGIGASFIEIGFNTLIDNWFTPSKKSFALEAHLKIENEFLMTGLLTWKFSKIKADGKSKYEELHSYIRMFRWNPECQGYFYSSAITPIVLHPEKSINQIMFGNLRSDKQARKYNKEIKKLSKERGQLYYDGLIAKKTNRHALSKSKVCQSEMFKWVQICNDSILRSKGYTGNYTISPETKPYIGFTYENINEKTMKANKLNNINHVYITSSDKNGPAFRAGLEKDDIILEIDGIKVTKKEDVNLILSDKQIGDLIHFKVQNKKKLYDLVLRVTWQ